MDQSDRHIEIPIEIATEEIGDRGKLPGRLGRAFGPRAMRVRKGFHSGLARHVEEADPREICRLNGRLAGRRTGEGELHVRLSRANPNIADEDVRNRHDVVTAHFQRERTASREGLEMDHPRSAGGRRLEFLPAHLNGDLLPIAGAPPDRDLATALQHGPGGKQGIRCHLGPQWGGESHCC